MAGVVKSGTGDSEIILAKHGGLIHFFTAAKLSVTGWRTAFLLRRL